MLLTTFKAQSTLQEGLQVDSAAGKFSIRMDEPESAGGTDTGMNPIEGLLCALGSCQCIVARMTAKNLGIDLQGFSVELEGDLDMTGMMGDSDARPGFQNIRCKFDIQSDASQEQIEKLKEAIGRFCPVSDSLAQPVKIDIE